MNATKRTRKVTRKPNRRDDEREMPGGPSFWIGVEVWVVCWVDEVMMGNGEANEGVMEPVTTGVDVGEEDICAHE